MIRPFILSALALSVFAPAAFASCDISNTKCALRDGSKCNIKFRNLTGASRGMDRGSILDQESWAQIVKVKALKENDQTAGNVLTIGAGESNTMNLDKKANKSFAKLRITSPAMKTVKGVTMSCEDVQSVLDGNGTCKIIHGAHQNAGAYNDYRLGYNCDGGKVMGPRTSNTVDPSESEE